MMLSNQRLCTNLWRDTSRRAEGTRPVTTCAGQLGAVAAVRGADTQSGGQPEVHGQGPHPVLRRGQRRHRADRHARHRGAEGCTPHDLPGAAMRLMMQQSRIASSAARLCFCPRICLGTRPYARPCQPPLPPRPRALTQVLMCPPRRRSICAMTATTSSASSGASSWATSCPEAVWSLCGRNCGTRLPARTASRCTSPASCRVLYCGMILSSWGASVASGIASPDCNRWRYGLLYLRYHYACQ